MSTKAKYDDLNTPAIAIVGFVSAILTFVSIIGFQAGYYYVESAVEVAKNRATGPTRNETILAEQRGKLATYGWVDKEQKTVGIPIDQAMALVLNEQTSSAGANAEQAR